jgi:ribosomal protein S18 acetylase RimI-like enzyme
MMSVPQYEPEMDLVAIAPNGELAAFCVCGFDDAEKQVGYTDPIGTHPDYRRIGLGKAIVSSGMQMLKTRNAKVVELGTSSDNLAMQGLAEALGFERVSERLWFSKTVS